MIQGGQKKTTTPPEEGKEEVKTASTSRQSYTQQADNFGILLQLLSTIPTYNPNEDDLKVETLQTKLTELKNKNTNLINAYTSYSNAMIDRNQTLYNPLTGLTQTAKEVKQYIKSIFGATSPQYKQVSGLEFKVVKND